MTDMPTIKVKVTPIFPSAVTVDSPLLLDTTGGAYHFALDVDALSESIIIPLDGPSSQIGLTPVLGVSTTAMRSDAAPPLSQSIAPTWTGTHTFNNAARFTGNNPANGPALFAFSNTMTSSAGTSGHQWNNQANNVALMNLTNAGVLSLSGGTASLGTPGTSLGSLAFAGNTSGSTTLRPSAAASGIVNIPNGPGTLALTTDLPVGANPTGSIGLTAVNGAATTFMRSDAAPALGQGIAPTWTGTHTFNNGVRFTGANPAAGPSMFSYANTMTYSAGTSGHQWNNQSNGTGLMNLTNTGDLILSSGTATFGTAGTSLGTVIFAGNTSGTTTLRPAAAASGTLTLPAATDTLVGKATTDTLTNKTINGANNTLTVRLANDVTGSLPFANGGTGKVTLTQPATGSTLTIADGKALTANASLTFAGTDGTTFNFPSAGGSVVTGASTNTFANKTIDGATNTLTVRLASDVTGNLPVTNLASGSGASSTTYWRGDGTWATPATTASNPSASVGLSAVNGAASTFMRSDAAPALSQSIAPTWTGKHTFTTNAGGIELAGSPSISKGFSGQTLLFGQYTNLTAADTNLAECAAHFGIASSTGATPNTLIAYKMAIATSTTVNAGSGSGWGINPVVNIGAGGTIRGGVGVEVNINNDWGSYTGSPGNPYAAGMLITGTNGGGYSSAAIAVEFGGHATNPMWNYGLHFGPPGYKQFNTAAIGDESNSPIIFKATGSHQDGINFASASFAGAAIYTPGFIVTGTGDVLGASAAIQGAVTSNKPVASGWKFVGEDSSAASVATSSNLALPAGSGLYIIRMGTGLINTAAILVGAGSCALLGQTGTLWEVNTNSPAAGHASIYWDGGTSTYRLVNNQGATQTFFVANMRCFSGA